MFKTLYLIRHYSEHWVIVSGFAFHSLIYSFFDVAVYGFTGSSRSGFDFFVFFLLNIKRDTLNTFFTIFSICFFLTFS